MGTILVVLNIYCVLVLFLIEGHDVLGSTKFRLVVW